MQTSVAPDKSDISLTVPYLLKAMRQIISVISKHLSECRGKMILEVYIELLILNTDIAKKNWHHGAQEAAFKKQLNCRMTLIFLWKTG